MAEALIARGLEVTLVEMKDQILASALDFSMAALAQRELRKNGVALRLAEAVQRVITSYSIHYTKLYEIRPAPPAPWTRCWRSTAGYATKSVRSSGSFSVTS